MSEQRGLAWLATVLVVLGAALLLASGLGGSSQAEVLVGKVEVAPVDLTISEPSGSDAFTMTLTSEPTAPVFVDLSTSNSECTASHSSVELNTSNWASGVAVTVTAVDDPIADGTQLCRILTAKSRSDDPNYDALNVRDVRVTVLDDDLYDIVVVPPSMTINEPAESAILTVTLTSSPTAPVFLPLSASNEQCTVSPGSAELNATNWAEGVTATVTAVDDAIADGSQTCTILTGPAVSDDINYGGLNPEDVTVTVHDDDTPGIIVLPTSLTVDEPSSSANFTLSLNSQPEGTVTVPLSASNGQCTVSPASVDLNAANWANGVAASVTAVDDAIADGSQTCTIVTGPATSGDTNYAGLDADDVTVTVNDDDSPGIIVLPKSLTIDEPTGSDSFVLSLNSQPEGVVSIPLSASSSQCTVSPASVDLDAANWSDGVTALVTAVDDAIADGPQPCAILTGPAASSDGNYAGLDPDDVTVTVNDDDVPGISVVPKSLTIGEPSGSDRFTLTLHSEPEGTVTIPLSASNSQCTVSPGSVNLAAANWNQGVTATVTAVDDAVKDGPQICTILTGPTVSSDTNYTDLDPDDVTVTVHDDDTPGIVVVPTSLVISEPAGSDIFTVSLNSQPESTVTIPLSASNGQCTVSPASIHLDATNWADGVSATATAVNDAIKDGTQICTILIGPATSSDTNYSGLDPEDVTVTVNDDDQDPPGITVSPTTLTVSEPSGSDSFVLILNTEPKSTVSIPLSASNGQCTVSPTSVHLDAANWTQGVIATVTAVDDTIIDGPKICTILTGPATSSDAQYDGQDPDDITVTVLDNDSPGITVFPIQLTIQEPSGSDTFTLFLNSQPLDPVTIPLSASNDECTVTPASVQLHAANWDIGVSATVTAVDDDIYDGTQACLILTGPTTSDDPAYHGLDPANVSVAVDDNDWQYKVYLPSTVRAWPPIPGVPTLNPISNADGNGTYDVSWSTAPLATGYVLEESIDHFVSDAREIYAGSATHYAVTQQGPTRYSYRVKARNAWGDGGWSGVKQVDVLWEMEPNDLALSQANGPLVSGLTYYGTFPSGDDSQDYYYFDLPAAHFVEVGLRNIPAGHNYDLVLRRADLSQVGYSAQPNNQNERIRTGTLPPGRYYIQVYHFSSGGSSQAYHLDITYK